MDTKNIDTEHLKVTGAESSTDHVTVQNDVIIIVTQAYGPDGDSLVGINDATFDGYPAVTVGVRYGANEGLVNLSPFHGDKRKSGFLDIPEGTRLELFCPVSKKPLEIVGTDEGSGATYHALYLSARKSEGDIVALSNVWGDYTSRIIDNYELISSWSSDDEE